MAPVGPQLPAAMLEKRKRDDDDDDDNARDSSSGSDLGPDLPPYGQLASKRSRVIGPTLPSTATRPDLSHDPNRIALSDNESENNNGEAPDEDENESEDDFGPAPPVVSTVSSKLVSNPIPPPTKALASPLATGLKRDEWMTVAPENGDWSSRIDPTKLKNRKFKTSANTGTRAAEGGARAWHETPAEKQARLQREMMGYEESVPATDRAVSSMKKTNEAETARRMKELNKARGPTLYQSHQDKQDRDKDDDPSARVFDREKDIGGGLQMNATQRRDMMKKASDFSSRFSSAKYL